MAPKPRDVTTLAATLVRVRPFPGVVAAVQKMIANPDTSASDVARVVERDIGVATDLLRVANAPTSALAQRCTNVPHAVSLLGLRRVSELVASAAALALIEKAANDFPELVAHILGVAGISRMLAPITGLSPDEAFTAGLLHDVAILLLLQSEDPFYEGLVDSCGGDVEPSLLEERALMGFDHAMLGGAVVKKWNLPEPLPTVVKLHHDWAGAVEAGGAVCAMVAVLRVADTLVPMLRDNPSPMLEDLEPVCKDQAFAYLGLYPEELFNMWDGLRKACLKTSLVAGPPSTRNVAAAPVPPQAAPMASESEVPEEPAKLAWPLVAAAALAVVGAIGAAVMLL